MQRAVAMVDGQTRVVLSVLTLDQVDHDYLDKIP